MRRQPTRSLGYPWPFRYSVVEGRRGLVVNVKKPRKKIIAKERRRIVPPRTIDINPSQGVALVQVNGQAPSYVPFAGQQPDLHHDAVKQRDLQRHHEAAGGEHMWWSGWARFNRLKKKRKP